MKIDFTKIEAVISFEGDTMTYNMAKILGNDMMYNTNILLDIGFEDLAREIYYSDGEVEIQPRYADAMIHVIRNGNMIAPVKRVLIKKLSER